MLLFLLFNYSPGTPTKYEVWFLVLILEIGFPSRLLTERHPEGQLPSFTFYELLKAKSLGDLKFKNYRSFVFLLTFYISNFYY